MIRYYVLHVNVLELDSYRFNSLVTSVFYYYLQDPIMNLAVFDYCKQSLTWLYFVLRLCIQFDTLLSVKNISFSQTSLDYPDPLVLCVAPLVIDSYWSDSQNPASNLILDLCPVFLVNPVKADLFEVGEVIHVGDFV